MIKLPEKRYEYINKRFVTSSVCRLLGGIFIISRSGHSYASETDGGNSLAKSILKI